MAAKRHILTFGTEARVVILNVFFACFMYRSLKIRALCAGCYNCILLYLASIATPE